jgi:hypothetical protein
MLLPISDVNRAHRSDQELIDGPDFALPCHRQRRHQQSPNRVDALKKVFEANGALLAPFGGPLSERKRAGRGCARRGPVEHRRPVQTAKVRDCCQENWWRRGLSHTRRKFLIQRDFLYAVFLPTPRVTPGKSGLVFGEPHPSPGIFERFDSAQVIGFPLRRYFSLITPAVVSRNPHAR